MARYREIADDLRVKIKDGTYPVGGKLPTISELQDEYNVPGLNTIRAAQQILVDEKMLETRQGIGAFVTSASSARELDVTAALTQARESLTAALSALEARGKHAITFDLLADDDLDFVLTESLREFAARQRAEVEDDPAMSEDRLRWAQCADRAVSIVERVATNRAA